MDIGVSTWAITIAIIIALFVFEFFAHVRKPHAPSLKEAGIWSLIYVAIAGVFGVVMWGIHGSTFASEFFAGYVTEKALSVDNLFVFVIIMASFAVPREFQQKVLMVGIVIALILRGLFIAAGSAAISHFSWVFYIFGAFLLYTAVKLYIDHRKEVAAEKRGEHGDEDNASDNALMRFVQRVLPTTTEYHGDKLTVRIDGKRLVTPMLIVMIAIGSTDVLFALDSIPAIFGLTQEPFIVFTANAFALMGLRQLFFLLDGLLDKLVFLSYGLAIILGFIGVKLVLHALHENELPFLNGGKGVHVVDISTGTSLIVIMGVLFVTVVASLIHGKITAGNEEKQAA